MHSAKRSLHHAVGAELTPLTPLPELAMPSSGSARRIVQIFPKETHRLKPRVHEVEALLRTLTSERKVRPVVTPSGHRARGHFPSLKGRHSRYESLVEEDALRVFEVASSVVKVATHPMVLRLPDADGAANKPVHYTPDMFVTLKDTATVVEVKGDWLLSQPTPRANLGRILRALRRCDVPLALLSESDVRPEGLQTELGELLRVRPIGGRKHDGVDASLWDPLGRSTPSADVLRRWRAAQQACDALLDRVMRRDPDQVIESLQA